MPHEQTPSLANILSTTILVAAAAASLFILFRPVCEVRLLYANLAATALVWVAACGHVCFRRRASGKSQPGLVRTLFGRGAAYYAVVATCWTGAYNLLWGASVSFWAYAAIHAIVCLCWLMYGATMSEQEGNDID